LLREQLFFLLSFLLFLESNDARKLDNEQVVINDLNAKLNKLKSVIEKVEEYKKEKQDLGIQDQCDQTIERSTHRSSKIS
jgi:hypothetical protein